MDVSGRVALVTGAAKRIGRAIALELADAGADLILHVHASAATSLVDEVRAQGRQVWVVRADLTQSQQVMQLYAEARAAAGRIDILVNNAAVFFPTPLARLTLAEWRRLLATNLTAPFGLALVCGRDMGQRGAGKIIQLGDWSGLRPSRGYLGYCVSKGGLHALTTALAKAFAPQVQVNTVAPGPILPPVGDPQLVVAQIARETPLGRFGQPRDIARTVRFLVEQGDYITGATYLADGGWLAKEAGGSGIS